MSANRRGRGIGVRVAGVLLLLFGAVGAYSTITKAPDPYATAVEGALEEAGRPMQSVIAIIAGGAFAFAGVRLVMRGSRNGERQ